MMDYTDVHYRQLARMMSRKTWLYTEMVVDSTLIFNHDHDRFLSFPAEQHPISCQLGGSNPETLGKAAAIVARYGYDEINLNCGCPSDRVAGAGCFGAAMMLEPKLVADCCKAMAEAAPGVEITVKCRIGVDDEDSYESMHEFIRVVSENSPVTHFIIHARKCLLNGLSPHQNRTVPPLRYEWLLAMKRDFPHLKFSLNGGILTLEEAVASMEYPGRDEREERDDREERVVQAASQEVIHGVMIGRAAYGQPWQVLSSADTDVFGAASNPMANRKELLYAYARYADGKIGSLCVKPDGHKMPSLRTLTKPILGMFSNEPRGKKWRAAVDTELRRCETLTEVLDKTLGVLPEDVLMRAPQTSFDREALDCTRVVPSLARPLPAVGSGDRAGKLPS
jgi:tRNA-dihydrouridine synthase A